MALEGQVLLKSEAIAIPISSYPECFVPLGAAELVSPWSRAKALACHLEIRSVIVRRTFGPVRGRSGRILVSSVVYQKSLPRVGYHQ